MTSMTSVDCYMKGDYAGCKELLMQRLDFCASEQSMSSILLVNIALCDVRMSLYRKALSHLRRAIELDPMNLGAYRLLRQVLMKLGKKTEASGLICFCLDIARTSDAIDFQLIDDLSLSQELSAVPVSVQLLHVEAPTKKGITLDQLYDSIVVSQLGKYNTQLIEAVRQNMHDVSGTKKLDDVLAVGYLHVNTGDIDGAISVFSMVNEVNDKVPATYLGLGSALAMCGRFQDASHAFSVAISLNPALADAYKRRGQTRAALDQLSDALQDMTRAIDLAPSDCDAYVQRALVSLKLRTFRKALDDFMSARRLGEDSAVMYNGVGMVHLQLGNISEALGAYDEALKRDPSFVEALLNKGRLLKEAGDYSAALEAYEEAMRIDTVRRFPQTLKFTAQLHYSAGGYSRQCIDMISQYLIQNPTDLEAVTLLALCHQSLGCFTKALTIYDRALAVDTTSSCWYLRETLLFYCLNLDNDPWKVSPDNALDPRIKDGMCKQLPWVRTMVGYTAYSVIPSEIIDIETSVQDSHRGLLQAALRLNISAVLQLQCVGFMPNCRQRAMFAMASLQCAARVLLKMSREVTWREYCDIAVRWRQVSEPNDCVYWIDGFPSHAFNEGFGLTTPMLNGELKTFRYYSYCDLGLQTVKRLLFTNHGRFYNSSSEEEVISSRSLERLAAVTSVSELHEVVGKDFYVTTQCVAPSSDQPSEAEGTRITLLKSAISGFEFTIRTPGTPERWKWYEAALTYCFDSWTKLIHDESATSELILRQALEFFYYFVNFAPLSRGTASVAYAMLSGGLLARGKCISAELPRNIQLDWEAIFSSSKEDFICRSSKLLIIEKVEGAEELISQSKDVVTYRDMLSVLQSI